MTRKSKTQANIAKGLFGALCFMVALISTDLEKVKAESTTDDLRAYLGMTVEKTDEKKKDYVVNSSEFMDMSQQQVREEDITLESDILKNEFSCNLAELEQMMKSNINIYKIIDKINETKESKNKVDNYDYSKEIIEYKPLKPYTSDKDGMQIYNSEEDINSNWYNIGDIGVDLLLCTQPFSIYEPFGYKIRYTDKENNKYEIIGEKNKSLKIRTSAGQVITSIFNGEVHSITENKVKIYHGKNIYTVFEGIELSEKVTTNGQKIKQYQILGTAISDNISIQLIIDDEHINPLVLFGRNGKTIYREFTKRSLYDYVVESNEHYYYTDDISVENPNRVR